MFKPLSEAEDLSSLFEKNTIQRSRGTTPGRIARLALPEPITDEAAGPPAGRSSRDASSARGQLLAFPGREEPTILEAVPDRRPTEVETAQLLAQAKAELQKQFKVQLQSHEAHLQSQIQLLDLSQALFQLDQPLESRLKIFLRGLCQHFDFWRLRLWVPEFGYPIAQTLRLQELGCNDLHLNTSDDARLRQVLRQGQPQRIQESQYTQHFWPLSQRQQTFGVLESLSAPQQERNAEQHLQWQKQLNLLADYLYASQQAAHQSAETHRDPLTGLLNHRGFFEALEKALQESPNFPLQLICLNLDYFNQINDVHGHLLGDKVLQQLAVLLAGLLPVKGQLGRLQGDQFAALLPQTSVEQGEALAQKWRAAVASLKLQGKFEAGLNITLSLGLATAPTKGSRTLHTFLQQAQAALQRAKDKGRNRVQIYSSAMLQEPTLQAKTLPASVQHSRLNAEALPASTPQEKQTDSELTEAKPWSELLKELQSDLESEWLRQAEDYGLPEVLAALAQIKTRLPRLLDAFGKLLERKTQLKDLEQMPISYFIPSPMVAAIRRGDVAHQLISYEVAFMLLQESLQQVLGQRAEALNPALDAFFHCVNDKLTILKTELQS